MLPIRRPSGTATTHRDAEAREQCGHRLGSRAVEQLSVLSRRRNPGRDDGADARHRNLIDEVRRRTRIPMRSGSTHEENEARPAFLHAARLRCRRQRRRPFPAGRCSENSRCRNAVKRSSSRVLIWSRGYGRSIARSSRMVAGARLSDSDAARQEHRLLDVVGDEQDGDRDRLPDFQDQLLQDGARHARRRR